MLSIRIEADSLRTALHCALVAAEEMSILHGCKTPCLVSPCGEGHLVQRLPARVLKGHVSYALSPTVLDAAKSFLSGLSGTVELSVARDELSLSGKSPKGSCAFTAGVSAVSSRDTFAQEGDIQFRASGPRLRDTLRQTALPPCLTTPNGEASTLLAVSWRPETLEILSTNGLAKSWALCPAESSGVPGRVSLPATLIRRTASLSQLWSRAVTVRVGTFGCLGNSARYLVWNLSAGSAPKSSPEDELKASWSAPSPFSCWIRVRDLVRDFDRLRKAVGKIHPPGLEFTWNESGLRLSPVFRTFSILDAFGHARRVEGRGSASTVQASQSIGVAVNSVATTQPGSLVVPTEALYLLKEVMPDEECQLKISTTCFLLGSPSRFIAVPTVVE